MSVCPSVKRVHTDKNTQSSAYILIPYKRSIYLVYWQEKLVGGTTPRTWNFGPNWTRLFENSDFQSIFTRSASAVTPSEKSSVRPNTKRKSTTRISMSLRWTSYVAPKPPWGGLKNAKRRFPSKIALLSKKVCYDVSLCENRQPQSCKAFTLLYIDARMVHGGRPLLRENLSETDPPLKTLITNQYSFVAPQLYHRNT